MRIKIVESNIIYIFLIYFSILLPEKEKTKNITAFNELELASLLYF